MPQTIKHVGGCLSQIKLQYSAGSELGSISGKFADLLNYASRTLYKFIHTFDFFFVILKDFHAFLKGLFILLVILYTF